MRRKNSGIILLILVVVILLVIAILVIVYVENEQSRELQISAFKQFAADHNYSLTVGTVVSFTNVITLDLNAFEQKCITLSSESNFGIIEQHTHSWLVLPQEKYTAVDWQTNTAYQWIV
jgi:uncharacterized membrane protein YeiB